MVTCGDELFLSSVHQVQYIMHIASEWLME